MRVGRIDKPCTVNEPLSRDGEINAANPAGSTNNVNELPTIVDNEVYEISNCESIWIINDVEKSLSDIEGRLHDEESNNRATNTEVAVTKNYHKYESHDSAKVNYSTYKLQKVSEDDRRKSTVRSNVSFPSKYQMRNQVINH